MKDTDIYVLPATVRSKALCISQESRGTSHSRMCP